MTLTTDEGPVVYDTVWSSSEQKKKKKGLENFHQKEDGQEWVKNKMIFMSEIESIARRKYGPLFLTDVRDWYSQECYRTMLFVFKLV